MTRSEAARVLGSLGGRARSARLSAVEKRRIAALGAEARLRSLRAARRIADNFRYVAAIDELGGRRPRVEHDRTFAGPLPGIYAGKTPNA